jgi:His-Xaa-Ser system radical SAM maturase HxsB
MDLIKIRPRAGTQAPFRFREVAGKVLVTSMTGDYLLLEHDEFAAYARGEVDSGSELETRLRDGGFLKDGFDQDAAAQKLAQRRRHLHYGPLLHILVVTLRCNETCVYCHASRANMDAVQTDMSKETAERAVDVILSSPNAAITIEFQGGEPLVAFDVVKHVVEYATEKNAQIGKQLSFTMVSNLGLMDEEKMTWLLDRKVQICTSIDGPEKLHNGQRKLPTGDAYQLAAGWMKRINERYVEMGLDPVLYHVEALLTTTKASLPLWKEIIDTYVSLGCKTIFLRPVDPFGFAERTRLKVEYPRGQYLEFYRNAVDYILELNKQGVEILERYAAIFLTKILQGEDPNFLDLRSPAGAGIGAIAYNYDGAIFTCDEGRMLYEMGDDAFKIGDLSDARYGDLARHPTVRALTLATNLDAQPDCVNCAYQPYCGTNGAYNHKSQGSVFGRMRDNAVCAVHKGIQDYLFEKLAEGDPDVLRAFERWTTIRPREHFMV